MASMPARCSSWPSRSPDGPAPTIATCTRCFAMGCLSPARLLAGILDVLELVELDVPELVSALLDPPHVDGLHDVAGVGVDPDGTARALRLPALHDGHRLVGVDLTVQLFHDVVDERHAIEGADRHEIGTAGIRRDLRVRLQK